MNTTLWKPAMAVIAFVIFNIVVSRISWDRIFFSERPLALMQSERATLEANGDLVAHQIEMAARAKGYAVKTGRDGNGMIYAEVHREPCWAEITQVGQSIYRFDIYASGKTTGNCEALTRSELLP